MKELNNTEIEQIVINIEESDNINICAICF